MHITNNHFLSAVAHFCESFSFWTGRAIMWLSLALVFIIILIILLKNFFSASAFVNDHLIKIIHLKKYAFGILFMCGIAYTLQQDKHVRIDIFYRSMNEKHKALVNLIGSLLFLLPLCILLIIFNTQYVIFSWDETTNEPGGLPYLYLIKCFLVIMPILLSIQGIANLIRSSQVFFSTSNTGNK